ncbi:MAG TPA: hypothetical protein PKA53_04105, partial [Sphingobacterium sp.]|nr:hypothetical protein [Sphingobacterium sp.]
MINEIFEFLGLSDKTIAEIVTWIIGTVTGGATILNGIKRKRTKTPKIKISDYFRDTETPLRSYTEYFIPNHLRIEEAGEMCSDNSINDLIKQELNKKGAKLYLLEASTGVGKTTYMVNLFLTLTKQIDPLAYLQLTANKKGIGYWCIWLGLHVWSAILGLLSIFGKNKTAHVILVRFNDLIADEKNLLQTYIDKKKASNTTVLIDAMDEYSPIVGSSDTEYWDKFKKDWETIAEALTHFKTSVISLREQFLKEKETTIGTIPCYRIKLLPFKKSQVDRYNAQRYENNVKVKHFFDRIDLLQEDKDNKLPSKSQTIHNIPLILSRAEDIVAHREEILKDDYSYYAILKVIVKEWLNREREKNNITKSIDKDNIEIFCQTIAYKLATQDSFSAGIPEDALTDMDISKDLRERIFGNRERTLLHRNKEVYSSQNIKTEVYHYRFVHRAFLEFFLV